MIKYKFYFLILPIIFGLVSCTTDSDELSAPAITTSGQMTEDETWSDNILLTGDVVIPAGITLTIEPNTVIKFTAKSDDQHGEDEYDPEDRSTLPAIMISILVIGHLDAIGTPDQPIMFLSNSATPDTMDWMSIMVEGDGKLILNYAVFEYGYFGVQLNSSTCEALIDNCTFRNIGTTGIATEGSSFTEPIVISNNQFIRCGREAVDTYPNQNIIVNHNLFSENYVAIMSVGSSIIIENNLFINNSRGIGVVEKGDPTIVANEFKGNQGAAIFVTDASPIISNNNIYNNFINIELGDSTSVTAENNWWGSIDKDTIATSIIDKIDDPSLGTVDFEPFALSAFNLGVPE